ncbi:MAG: Uma2 family endonuclease [Actinomycetota bacterium]|nr:Uma2 family endonuclease [Actinomycetota bacterium]
MNRLSKLSAYEEAGVASYWLVNPDAANPSLHALDLVDGHYIEVGYPSGEQAWRAQRPFRSAPYPRISSPVCPETDGAPRLIGQSANSRATG